jgi:hypothetical protein
VLGDYAGAIYQTIDPATGRAVRAHGGWIELEQGLPRSLTLHAGYGTDHVNAADVSPPLGRTANRTLHGNLIRDLSKHLSVAGELALWRTEYIAASAASPARIEAAIIYQIP